MKKNPVIFRFFTLSLEIPEKKRFTPRISAKLFYTTWKFQDLKPRPMEIPHDFYFITNALQKKILHALSSIPLEIPFQTPVWIFSERNITNND